MSDKNLANTGAKLTPQAFIFIGRSGSGKGTQAELLMKSIREKTLAENGTEAEILYVQTGQEFRNFIQGPSDTAKLSKAIYDASGLQPEFLAIYMWVHLLVEKYKTGQYLIFDGVARKIIEAGALDSVFDFYGFNKPHVINLDVGHDEVITRLIKRGRKDDNEKEIKRRLDWYDTDVTRSVEYYRTNPRYNFLKIDGARSIEAIHEDIIDKVGLV